MIFTERLIESENKNSFLSPDSLLSYGLPFTKNLDYFINRNVLILRGFYLIVKYEFVHKYN